MASREVSKDFLNIHRIIKMSVMTNMNMIFNGYVSTLKL